MKGLRTNLHELAERFETPENIRKAVEDLLERLNGFSCRDAEDVLKKTKWQLKYASTVNFEREEEEEN